MDVRVLKGSGINIWNGQLWRDAFIFSRKFFVVGSLELKIDKLTKSVCCPNMSVRMRIFLLSNFLIRNCLSRYRGYFKLAPLWILRTQTLQNDPLLRDLWNPFWKLKKFGLRLCSILLQGNNYSLARPSALSYSFDPDEFLLWIL